jgi:SAM-dependent methyltransferase
VSFGLPAGAVAIDVGCGEGRHSIELARRFGFTVLGVDPVERQLSVARRALREASATDPALPSRITFTAGEAGSLPVPDASVDLIWCREAIALVPRLEPAFAEFARVLRANGRALVYQVLATERLEPKEAARLWAPLGVRPENADPRNIERAIEGAVEVELETLSGDVRVKVPSLPDVDIDLETFSGGIERSSLLPDLRDAKEYSRSGKGKGNVRLHSFSGDIELQKR